MKGQWTNDNLTQNENRLIITLREKPASAPAQSYCEFLLLLPRVRGFVILCYMSAEIGKGCVTFHLISKLYSL